MGTRAVPLPFQFEVILGKDRDRWPPEARFIEAAHHGDVRDIKILWWGAYGGLAFELQSLAKRVISLCCSASGCERNWSEFSAIHTKKRNRLEHERLCKLVYVSYNRKMENRFEKIRQQGSKGKRSNPLVLEELMWENEWVHESEEGDELWSAVDDVLGATQATRGRNLPRAAAARGGKTYCETYVRRKRQKLAAAQDLQQGEGDGSGDGDSEDDPQVQELTTNEKDAAEKAIDDEEESGSAGDQFKLDDDLIWLLVLVCWSVGHGQMVCSSVGVLECWSWSDGHGQLECWSAENSIIILISISLFSILISILYIRLSK